MSRRASWVGWIVSGAALFALLVTMPHRAAATPGDTTWVNTFHNDFYNWATPHEQSFGFPAARNWRKILLRYRIGCPPTPDDCDPWDRIGYLRVLREVDRGASLAIEPVEIARVITPYDITGGSRPGTCTWLLDVSDYASLLHDQVMLSNYIESWIGGTRGWLVSIDFAFVEGEPALIPYRVTNLWNNYYAVYGDPSRPIEDLLAPIGVMIDPEAVGAKVRVTTTGHGQGNSGNCAEFCSKQHTVNANGSDFTHTLWRSNALCLENSLRSQGGTWTLPRAGWCPGDKVDPWEVDVTGQIVAGSSATFDYSVQPYTNFAAYNPNCISGSTCTNCQYDNNGHTEPIYAIASQLIEYRVNPASAVSAPRATTARAFLEQNLPTRCSSRRNSLPGRVARQVGINLVDASGRLVRRLQPRARDGRPLLDRLGRGATRAERGWRRVSTSTRSTKRRRPTRGRSCS
ncbi:MAG: peptide-N-glycosidase F-related protein [Candidatus Eisenbacteria bacterium]